MTGIPAAVRTRRIESSVTPEDLLPALTSLRAPALLDSSLGETHAWTFAAAEPTAACIDGLPPWTPGQALPEVVTPSEESDPEDVRPPFRTGWIGYLTYESAPSWNPDLTVHAPDPTLPLAVFCHYAASLAYRHRDRSWWLSSSRTQEGEMAAGTLLARLREAAATPDRDFRSPVQVGALTADLSPSAWVADVSTVRDWIARGHVYQVNLTYRLRAAFQGRGPDLYARLRRTSPAPFGAYFRPDVGESASPEILAATPELFLALDGDRVRTSPIKGTRPRDLGDPQRDRALARELFTSAKDRAELTMIVDLERNDLGRVCRTGTVRTSAFPRLASYRGVHHLLADVEGELRPGTSLRDLLAATFPGGSVTGAPKIRSMEIIRSLESTPRGIYTGALGYLDDSGRAVLALTIRTLAVTGDEVRLGVGGGIVTDSDPEREWQETLDKIHTLREALVTADAFAVRAAS